MQPRRLALTALLLAAAPLAAQMTKALPVNPPAAPPAAGQPADAIDDYLDRWQATMEQVQSLSAQLRRSEKDQTTTVEQRFTGYTKYLRVSSAGTTQNLALLEMTPEGKKEFSERYVCSGAFLYEFSQQKKEIRAHELPKPKEGQVSDDNFLGFLFGMKATAAKQRYDLKLDHTDKDYIYVMIEPRFAADKVDFKRAQMVLNKNTMLPRRLWFEQANSTETTWDVFELKSNDKTIDRREFDKPTPDPGWKMVNAPKDAESPPRVARPSGN
jgi:TIGR03009 family protein